MKSEYRKAAKEKDVRNHSGLDKVFDDILGSPKATDFWQKLEELEQQRKKEKEQK